MVVLLAMVLSMDAFGIGVSYRIRKISVPVLSKLIICFLSVVSTYAASVFGRYISSFLSPFAGSIIGSAVLALTGFWIIFTASDNSVPQKNVHKIINIGSITVTVVKNPESCDFDKSRILEPSEALYMGAALSIDSFCSGIASGFMSVSPAVFSLLAGGFQMAFLYLGEMTGKALVKSKVLSDKTCVVLSGVLLIAIAASRLIR